jgi:2-hydroxy-3-oxopropionate reductase
MWTEAAPGPLLSKLVCDTTLETCDTIISERRKTLSKVGFIGLGIMGKPMSRNLMKAGHNLVVYDIVPEFVDAIVADGAERGKSCSDVASRSEVIITMLPDGPQVEEAVLGSNGVLEGIKPGSTVVDMSSINPLVAQKVGAACGEKGVEFLDAPVSGGEPKAIDGTLAIMVGGKKEVFEKFQPLLQRMGSSVTLTGPVGAGNVTKLANQMMVACNIAAMGEALVLATRAGLDPEVVFNAVKGGLAGSTVLNAKAPMVIGRNFKPGFRIRLHQKDLRNALQVAESMKVALPLTGLVQQMLMALMNQGKGDLDHSAIATFIEGLAGIEVKKP